MITEYKEQNKDAAVMISTLLTEKSNGKVLTIELKFETVAGMNNT